MRVSDSTRLLCILFLVGAALGAGAYFATKSRSAHADDAVAERDQAPLPVRRVPESSPDETVRLRRQIAALESSVAALLKQKSSPAPAHSATSDEAAASDETSASLDSTSSSDTGSEAGQEQAEKQLFSRIGASFAAQPVDSGWSAAMSARITSQIANLGPQSARVDSVECHSSACRIEISNYDEESRETIRNKLQFGLADVLGSGAITRDEGGRTFIYLAKDPQALGIGAPATQP
jgi:hypothetical protein